MDETTTTTDYGVPAPGHRLPADTRVGGVRLQVADLERSLDWYGRVLGARELERGETRAALGAAGDARPLIELEERSGAVPAPLRGRPGLYHFAVLLPDRAALGAFLRHLSELGERAGASDHRVSEAIYLRDPDGLGIEVYADRPRSGWRHREGQLVMATDPLDVAGLMDAAAGVEWTGLPPGTTLGHVHLHVGDLARAAAFYHEALGLDKQVWSYPGALFLSAGGYHHHLGLNTWAGSTAPAGDDEAKLLEWTLVVPSRRAVERAADAMEVAGYAVERSGEDVRTRDPWGTRLRIHAAEPRGVADER